MSFILFTDPLVRLEIINRQFFMLTHYTIQSLVQGVNVKKKKSKSE